MTTVAIPDASSALTVNSAERIFMVGAVIILSALVIHRVLLSDTADHVVHVPWLSESDAALGLLSAVMNFNAWKRIIMAMNLFAAGTAESSAIGVKQLMYGVPMKIGAIVLLMFALFAEGSSVISVILGLSTYLMFGSLLLIAAHLRNTGRSV